MLTSSDVVTLYSWSRLAGAMHPFDLLFNCLIVNNFAFFLIVVLFALFVFFDIKLIWFIILCWDVVQL